jgi:hypothetical protein
MALLDDDYRGERVRPTAVTSWNVRSMLSRTGQHGESLPRYRLAESVPRQPGQSPPLPGRGPICRRSSCSFDRAKARRSVICRAPFSGFCTVTGWKKCVPNSWAGRLVAQAIPPIAIEEVSVANIALGHNGELRSPQEAFVPPVAYVAERKQFRP